MKTKAFLATGLLIASSAIVFAAPDNADTSKLQIYPKNLARQNVGTNLFLYNATSQNYVPTEAAAAWLDDDVATGWPAAPGKSYYLLTLSEPQLLTNFEISTKAGSAGTVTLYAGDELAPPTSKSWTPIAKDLTVDSINDKKLAKPFSRFAKYVLIETNLTDPSPWYSLYLYGDKPAAGYNLQKRAASVDTNSIFGQFVNNQTMFNLSSLYAKGMVTYVNTTQDTTAMQKAIDDNPESNVSIAPSKDEAGMILHYADARQIQRLSVMADPSAKGRLDFYLVTSLPNGAAPVAKNADGSDYIKVANTTPQPLDATAADTTTTGGVSVAGMTPTATLVLDGSTGRGSIEFPAIAASYVIVRWTPETAGQSLAIGEVNTFGDFSLNDYALVSDLPAVGEQADFSKDKDMSKDKQAPPPVGELLPGKNPFVPGGLGFPPNLTHLLSP